MTRKDYIAIGTAVGQWAEHNKISKPKLQLLASALSSVFEDDNQLHDREKFLDHVLNEKMQEGIRTYKPFPPHAAIKINPPTERNAT